jgi:DNA-binding GntR family transcriptional regulator
MSESAVFNLRPPARHTLADGITESLRDAIFGGLVRPGQRLAEGKLASSLKVSRAPVREALALLEQEGLVHRAPSGAMSVTRVSLRDVDEICTLRTPLEAMALRLAIAGGTAPEKQLSANIRASAAVRDARQLAEQDLAFHEIMVRAANHSRLLTMWLVLRSQIRLIMVQHNLADADSPRATVEGHKRLFQAIQNRDVDKAVAVLEDLLRRQHDWIMRNCAESNALDAS